MGVRCYRVRDTSEREVLHSGLAKGSQKYLRHTEYIFQGLCATLEVNSMRRAAAKQPPAFGKKGKSFQRRVDGRDLEQTLYPK